MTEPVLELRDVRKRFGGIEVLSGIDLVVGNGERVAVIGPNGAGKSTLFNVISGALAVSGGTIRLGGEDITGTSPHQRVRGGIGRSFQLTSVLPGLSVLDNTLLALHGCRRSRFGLLRPCSDHAGLRERAESLIGRVGLSGLQERPAAALSYGEQKKLEIAMTLALEPRVLMLDEPAAGLARGEVASFIDLVRQWAVGCTLLFTEHDMDVVFGLADRIVVLCFGQIIASGTPEDVRNDPRVQQVYLGAGEADHAEA